MKRSAMQMRGESQRFLAVFEQDALTRPKPMIRVGPKGEPLLQFILEQALRAGFTEVTLVVSPDDSFTKPFVENWNKTAAGLKMRTGYAVQSEPLGTAHAVQCALEQDPVASGTAFVLCNGDNVPTRRALSKLRSLPQGQAVLAYDRDHLGLPPEKTKAFAVLQESQGELKSILEKPEQNVIDRLFHQHGIVHVSMNLFRLDPHLLLPFLERLTPHSTRGELELPTALQQMLLAGHTIQMVETQDEVLDLTRFQDVVAVQNGLRFLEPFQLEVCASTPMDVEVARDAGAHRVELCAHWPCGGLTPPESDIRRSVMSGIPVHALIRPRAGHFQYSADEKAWMTDQIAASLEAGAVRAVVGGLNDQARLDLTQLELWAAQFGAHRLVVHRALDASDDWKADVEALKEIGILRMLSSGGAEKAMLGRDQIKDALQLGFEVTVGSGVRPEQLAQWQKCGVHAFHASCRREMIRSTKHFDGVDHPVVGDEVRAWFL
jgi:copper homeostasis protein CutC/UTP-glucose-1-phosphate uridylyltransferase